MDLVDDTQLVMMARKPAGEMFLVLRRPSAFAPLLMLLCVLPSLYSLEFRTYDESDALWGLRALDLHDVSWWETIVRPPREGAAGMLRWQPPLGSWITAGLLRLTHSAHPALLMSVSFLSVAATVAMFVLVLRTVASERVAFWGAILASFQGSLLALAGRFAPAALGVALGLVAMWGFLCHIERGTRRMSWPLFLGGVGLGGCLLAGGPLALGVAALLLLHVLGLRGESLSRRQWAGPKPIRVWNGWPALKSLLLMFLIGALVGAWWPVLRWWQDGGDFLASWFVGTPAAGSAVPLLSPNDATAPPANEFINFPLSCLRLCGPMFGLVLLGLARACQAMVLSSDEPRRRSQQFLVLWAVCGGVAWGLARMDAGASTLNVEQWQAFFGLSISGLGALAIDAIASRQLPMRFVVAVAALGAVTLAYVGWSAHLRDFLKEGTILLTVFSVAVAISILWRLLDSSAERDSRHRFVLGVILVAQLAVAIAAGLRSVKFSTEDDRALEAFRRGLPADAPVADVFVIGKPSRVPLRIRLTLQSAWPAANEQIVDSWDVVLARTLTDTNELRRGTIAVDWRSREGHPVNLQAAGIHITPLASLQFFEGGPLRAYLVSRDVAAAPTDGTVADRTDPARFRGTPAK